MGLAAGLSAAAGILLGRKAVAQPEVISGANSWEDGPSVQIRLEEVVLRRG